MLTRHIGHRDLNLATPTGRHQLEERIGYIAKEACDQLSSLHPFALWTTSNADSVAGARKDAMAQLPGADASAEQGQHLRR